MCILSMDHDSDGSGQERAMHDMNTKAGTASSVSVSTASAARA